MKEVLANLFIMNQYISLDYGWRGRGKGTLIQLRHFKNWEGIFDDGYRAPSFITCMLHSNEKCMCCQ